MASHCSENMPGRPLMLLHEMGDLPLDHLVAFLTNEDMLRCSSTCHLLRNALQNGVWCQPGAHRRAQRQAWANKVALEGSMKTNTSFRTHLRREDACCLLVFRQPQDYDFFARIEDVKCQKILAEIFVQPQNKLDERTALTFAWNDMVKDGAFAQDQLRQALEVRVAQNRFLAAESVLGALTVTVVAIEKRDQEVLTPPCKVVSTRDFVGIAESQQGIAYLLSTELHPPWHPWNIHTSIVQRRSMEDNLEDPRLLLEICWKSARI